MRVGLVIYGSIETLTGGYLYDRRLLDHLVSRGDRAEVISLPSRNHHPRALCDNASPSLVRRLLLVSPAASAIAGGVLGHETGA
jgi:hypothetical protein